MGVGGETAGFPGPVSVSGTDRTNSLGKGGQDGEAAQGTASVIHFLRQRKLPGSVRPRGQNQEPWEGKEHWIRSQEQGFQSSIHLLCNFKQVT